MRVYVQRVRDGERVVVVVPGRSQGQPPVILRGTTKEQVLGELREVVGRVRRGGGGELPEVPLG